MRDIANKIGVSSVTVSKALNDKDGVSEELKDKIKQLAADMGYRFNSVARSMKDGLSYNIGVVIPERFAGANQFYLHFYEHLSKVLDNHKYYGILQILNVYDEEQLVLPRIYHEKKVDGFIILGQISKPYMELLQQADVPFLFLDFYTDDVDIDAIISDNFYGMYEMTNYLIKQGHDKIAFVGNIYSTSSIQDRFLGYYKSILEHHLQLQEDYVIPDRDRRGTFVDLQLPKDMPTAFVCNCDRVAYILSNKLKEHGYRIPEDCSVVGFDNDIYSTIADPQLTTVEVNVEEMSQAAVKSIIEKVKNPKHTIGRLMVKGRIIHRQSVSAVKQPHSL